MLSIIEIFLLACLLGKERVIFQSSPGESRELSFRALVW